MNFKSHFLSKIAALFLFFFLHFPLTANQEINWPDNYVMVLKVRVGNMHKVGAVKCNYFNNINFVFIDAESLTYDLDLWHKIVQTQSTTQKKYAIKMMRNNESTENQVPHVCCVSILNGTCSHQAQLHIKPTADLEDLLLISENDAQHLGIEPLDTDELLDEVHTQMELARLSRFSNSVPEELIANKPVPGYMVVLRRVGIAVLLSYLQMQNYVGTKWHQLKSWAGYGNTQS